MLEVIRARGYTASLQPPEAPTEETSPVTETERARLDIRTVTHGDEVRIADHLVAGKYTIVDFYADWCGPCLLLGNRIERLMLERPDIALRKIDIVSWETEAAKQATREFNVKGIPYVRIYGSKGEFVGQVSGNNIDEIRALVSRPVPE